MSLKMRYEDSDKLEVMLGTIATDCEKAGIDTQKEGARVVKAAVISKLNSIRRSDVKDEEGNIVSAVHMADDVEINSSKDAFGNTTVKVRGGKKTGTLWHIVNDGTHRSKAHHFMDRALSSVEGELENILDKNLKKVF